MRYLNDSLEYAQNQPHTTANKQTIRNISLDISKWNKIKAEFWRQKVADSFFREVDNNTRYFHNFAKKKRKIRNRIDSLENNEGNYVYNRHDIDDILNSYFINISSTSNPYLYEFNHDLIPSIVISEEDNKMLFSIPTAEEIHSTVKGMSSWSSPGPDGFPAGFYKSQWSKVGTNIICMIQKFF